MCTFSLSLNSIERYMLPDTGPHVAIARVCHECNSTFHGCIVNDRLPHTPVVMDCMIKHFDKSVKHSKKRQLKGERWTKIAKLMADGNTMACTWRLEEGDELMDLGDSEPPHLPSNVVLWKAKEQYRNKTLNITEVCPIKSIQKE